MSEELKQIILRTLAADMRFLKKLLEEANRQDRHIIVEALQTVRDSIDMLRPPTFL